ncbi:MAG: TonB-dependent receptor [Proteobacteria bacterium]|nr:TonB-dependent receptor [Pseudomonadota bacterium]
MPSLPVGFIIALILCAAHKIAASEVTQDLDTDNGNRDDAGPWEDLPVDDDETYETVVRGYHILQTDEATGFAETISVADETETVNSVSEVLSEAVGVQVRRLGGLGSYGAASIRGSTSNQVPIYLDGVLLNASGFPSVDLGNLPIDILDSIEIYRGGAPLSLGQSGIGGAISLTTRSFEEPVTETAASYGSWRTARLLVLHGDQIGPVRALAILSTQGSRGDFEYLDHGGTPNNEEDDRYERRQNNEHVAYSGLFKLDGPMGSWKWTAANDLFAKRQGLPGIGNNPTETASLRTLRDNVTLRINGPVSRLLSLDLNASYMAMREDLNDINNEIGVGYQRTISSTDSMGGGALGRINWNEHHLTGFRIDSRYELFSSVETSRDVSPQRRVRTGTGLEHEWCPWPFLTVSSTIRLEVHNSRFSSGQGSSEAGELQSRTIDDHFWSPSLGAKWEIISGLFLRGNAGMYVRAPDIVELFGDRGVVIGNPELKPEEGINADAGFTYMLEHRGAISLLRIDAAWFGSWADDLIAYVQNSQNTIRPENIDAAEILGAETALRLILLRILSIEANYTYLHGINKSDTTYHRGERLPGRPAHEAYGKIGLDKSFEKWGAGVWADVCYAGLNYLEEANLNPALERILLGSGYKLAHFRTRLTLTVEVKNMLDTITVRDEDLGINPLRDFNGFPLPGRTILATLHWKI